MLSRWRGFDAVRSPHVARALRKAFQAPGSFSRALLPSVVASSWPSTAQARADSGLHSSSPQNQRMLGGMADDE